MFLFRPLVFALVSMAGLSLAGPARSADVGVALAGSRANFWPLMAQGAEDAARKHGVSVVSRSPMSDAEETIREKAQLHIIHAMLESGVKALVLAPMAIPDQSGPIDLGVPVVFVDRQSADFKSSALVSTDNRDAGRVAARQLQGLLPSGRRVAVVRLAPYITSTTEREEGFAETARALGFDVVFSPYAGYGVRETQDVVTRLLHSDPSIAALFAPNGGGTHGALRALSLLPKDSRPKLVGFDAEDGFEEALKQGDLAAFLVQDPYMMGDVAMQCAIKLLAGEPVPKITNIPISVVTKDTLLQPRIRKLLDSYRR